ncbi:hypothetical protein BZB76_4093 [Actinomadura pelletieri DSM 43383]|uniref:Uncharacterized protein n=1 Tax=Actinomadura pelletieri DSM 43383 TaxID=1120940 RepID=A0A495QLK2_9ACTN|nr:hypothetical protein [Actinomadura pelletieri]RKS73403.1 hypothetical protein BZB76_4093 [Actinomadura pelletieri DSM 43383]
MSGKHAVRRTAGLTIAATAALGLVGPAAHAAAAPAPPSGGPAAQVEEGTARPATRADLRAAGVPAAELTKAAAWKKKTVKLRWCWTEKKPKLGKANGVRCNILGVWTDVTFVYNGKKVYQHRVACNDRGIYNVSWQWCGYTGNGKASMSAGGNFKTNLGIGDAKVSYPYWMRMYMFKNGKVTTNGGKS